MTRSRWPPSKTSPSSSGSTGLRLGTATSATSLERGRVDRQCGSCVSHGFALEVLPEVRQRLRAGDRRHQQVPRAGPPLDQIGTARGRVGNEFYAPECGQNELCYRRRIHADAKVALILSL